MSRRCAATTAEGTACQATPLRGSERCFWHDPSTRAEAQEARRLGGLRRRREAAVAGAYEVGRLDTVAGLRRVLVIAVGDVLGAEPSRQRLRALLAAVGAGTQLLQLAHTLGEDAPPVAVHHMYGLGFEREGTGAGGTSAVEGDGR